MRGLSALLRAALLMLRARLLEAVRRFVPEGGIGRYELPGLRVAAGAPWEPRARAAGCSGL